jgi:hypothetical protein
METEIESCPTPVWCLCYSRRCGEGAAAWSLLRCATTVEGGESNRGSRGEETIQSSLCCRAAVCQIPLPAK